MQPAWKSVPRVATLPSPEDFRRDYVDAGQPVIFPIPQCEALNWTMDSLTASVGDTKVFTRVNTSAPEYKVGKSYRVMEVTFREYIDNLVNDTTKSHDCYLAVQNLKQNYPTLLPDVVIPSVIGKTHGGPYMWIAPKGHYEYCHMDADDNMLFILNGSKRVRVYPAHQLRNLYPNPPGSLGRTLQAQVDLEAPDLEKFPLFAEAEGWECVLNSGDMLFFPAFYWHQVTTLEHTISVNIFFGPAGDSNYIEHLLAGTQREAFVYWFLNIIEQNRPYPRFQRLLGDLRRSLQGFFMKQFHERPTIEQLDLLEGLVREHCHVTVGEQDESKPRSKNPPPLFVRGLLWRSADEEEND